jgi:hypothetical protein
MKLPQDTCSRILGFHTGDVQTACHCCRDRWLPTATQGDRNVEDD